MPGPDRIVTLDLIRGTAVLGILAINISGFAGPMAAVYTPRAIHPPDAAADAVFAVSLVLFEGKMRALFSLLFGAGMALFIARAEAAGRDGAVLQLRRLGWLALFGYLHYLLLWWGDILFVYAIAGMIVLMLRQLRPFGLLAAALITFAAWQADGVVRALPMAMAEQQVAQGSASPAVSAEFRAIEAERTAKMAQEVAGYRQGFARQVWVKISQDPDYPLRVTVNALGETVPFISLGMLLFQWGFFTRWSRARLRGVALAGIGIGGAATLLFAQWAWSHGFPFRAMGIAVNHALGFPHLLMALGYGALLVLSAPWLVPTAIGTRLVAAGRMAFSNYIGVSLIMTGLFYGWGLGLMGSVPVAAEPLFVIGGWLFMLAWSKPWLARFRQGPLEWLWRSLVEGRRVAFRREPARQS